MDNLDAALAAFNARVEVEQERARRRVALDLALDCRVTIEAARAALEACRWNVTRARRRLEDKHE